MSFSEYADYDGLGLAKLVKDGDVSPAELTEAAIERIEKHNGTLNAVVHKAYEDARQTAKSDLPDGPFLDYKSLVGHAPMAASLRLIRSTPWTVN